MVWKVVFLDAQLQLVPIGNEGTLYLTGAGLTTGYVNSSVTTSRRFVRLPHHGGKAWFNTGDLVKSDQDGQLQFCGRVDDQLKIDGVRVELAEIVQHMQHIFDCRCSVLMVDAELIAFVECDQVLDAAAIRAELSVKLLPQMLPQQFFGKSPLPMTDSGKVDRYALQAVYRQYQRTCRVMAQPDSSVLGKVQMLVESVIKVGADPDKNLFTQGIDSLSAVSCASVLSTAFAVKVPVRLIFEQPTIRHLAAVIGSLLKHPENIATTTRLNPHAQQLALTPAQKRIQYLQNHTHAALDIVIAIAIAGPFDTLKAYFAWQQTVQSDSVFKLVCTRTSAEQHLAATELPPLHYHDLTAQPDLAMAKLDELRRGVLTTPAQHAANIEAYLVRLTADKHQMIIRVSPYHCDISGLGLFLQRFQAVYKGAAMLTSATEYIAYMHSCAQLPEIQSEWLMALSRCNTAPMLSVRRRQETPAFKTLRYACQLDTEQATAISRYLELHVATPAAFFLMAYLILLRKYSGSDETIGVGTVVSHRHLCPNGLGPLTNFVVVAPELQQDMAFAPALHAVYQELLTAVDNQHIGIEMLVSSLRRKGEVLPVECLFLYQSSPIEQFRLNDSDCQIEALNSAEMPSLLCLEVIKEADHYALQLQYDKHLYSRQAMMTLAQTYRLICHQIATERASAPGYLWMLPNAIAQYCYGSTIEWHEDAELLHTCFTTTARRHPLRTAIIVAQQKITYGRLYRWSTRISRVIFKQKLAQTTPFSVAILMPKGWEQIAVVLGILRGGGVFAPLNPDLPEVELKTLLAEVGIRWIITTPLLKKLYHWEADCVVLTLDDPRVYQQSLIPIRKQTVAVAPDDPAYVLFTSGTTGQAKGVMISHRAALNTIFDMNKRLAIGPKDTFFALSNLYFDLSIYDIFGAFDQGANLVLPNYDQGLDVTHWEMLVRRHQVTVWNSVPVLYQLLLNQLTKPIESFRHILLSGDWIPLALPVKSRQYCPHAQLCGLGGATEASIWSVYYSIQTVSPDWPSIPYGLPMTNQTCYVLDQNLSVCAADTPGELYIGGVGVALGYCNNPTLTAQAFIRHPITHERLYRTGDAACLSSSGYFSILGRLDSRVKIAGQFVDLAAIEHEIQQYPGIQQAVVVAQLNDKRSQVAAFIVTTAVMAEIVPELRRFLSAKVTKVMMPTKIAQLHQLPLTINGKVNRHELERYTGSYFQLSPNGRRPRNRIEAILVDIWAELLATNVSIDDNFFEMGGDSLLALSAVGEIKQRLQIDVPVHTALMYQTVVTLAPALQAIQQNKAQQTVSADLILGVAPNILQQEVGLDSSIAGVGCRVGSGMQLGNCILLTGATGYLGSRLLLDLLFETDTEIFCLVRAHDVVSAMQRIMAVLLKLVSLEMIDLNRITPVIGDIAKPRLGLTRVDYALLAEQMDHIIHCAAHVNFILPRSALQASNVGGAIEILRLAAHCQIKRISYVSTVSVFPTIAHDLERVFKEDDVLDQGMPIFGGYAQSKWIAESIMQEGRRRDIPVTIFRPGVIFGDTRLYDLPKDVLLVNFLKLCIKIGAMPKLDIMVDIAPVDYVAKAIVSLSQHPNKNFHLTNSNPVHFNAFVKTLIDIGIHMTILAPKEWWQLVKSTAQADTEDSFIALMGMLGDINQLGALAFGRNLQQFDCQQSLAGLQGTDIICPPIDPAFMQGFVSALNA